ncbi:MAG: eL32 family ribosomal protein [archaeon]|jgi:large subunit ribosomal protein L32e
MTAEKTITKNDAKPKTEEKRDEKVAETKKEVKKKFIQFIKRENKKKSKEVYAVQKELKNKKSTPVFRGRFGKKNIRRKSIEKWDKWRKPHGIDLDKCIAHGFRPKIGYRNSTETRFIHPSGFKDVLVCNMNDLEKLDPKVEAARIARTIGKRKRNELMTKANEKGIWVLN